MEYEADLTVKTLRPWYQNSAHTGHGARNYSELLRKRSFLSTWYESFCHHVFTFE